MGNVMQLTVAKRDSLSKAIQWNGKDFDSFKKQHNLSCRHGHNEDGSVTIWNYDDNYPVGDMKKGSYIVEWTFTVYSVYDAYDFYLTYKTIDDRLRIMASAIRLGPHSYTGNRHCDVLNEYADRFGHAMHMHEKVQSGEWERPEQGFVTNQGFFVDRKEALSIARACGQVLNDTELCNSRIGLFSEDLW